MDIINSDDLYEGREQIKLPVVVMIGQRDIDNPDWPTIKQQMLENIRDVVNDLFEIELARRGWSKETYALEYLKSGA